MGWQRRGGRDGKDDGVRVVELMLLYHEVKSLIYMFLASRFGHVVYYKK